MAKPAPYTREVIGFMRTRAAAAGVHEIAVQLGWDAARVRTVAKHHNISLREDNPAGVEVVAAAPTPPEPSPTRNGTTKIGGFTRAERVGRQHRKIKKLHPRDCYATISLSRAAVEELAALAKAEGKRTSGIAAVVIDFIARNGRLEKLYALAKTEAA